MMRVCLVVLLASTGCYLELGGGVLVPTERSCS